MFNPPLAYFITFRTYATWLHGDERGSVDRTSNRFGTPMLAPNEARANFERSELPLDPVILTPAQRDRVEAAIVETCEQGRWVLHALNVRTNHVHLVITAALPPERILNSPKSWATRRLREAGLASADQRLWSRHGSTLYLFRPEDVADKIRYVREDQ